MPRNTPVCFASTPPFGSRSSPDGPGKEKTSRRGAEAAEKKLDVLCVLCEKLVFCSVRRSRSTANHQGDPSTNAHVVDWS